MLTRDGKNKRIFNVAGPCIAADHYMISDKDRGVDLLSLIDQKQFFVFHAARQCGKTTLFRDYMHRLEDSGDYYALYCSLESAYAVTDMKDGIKAVMANINHQVEYKAFAQNEQIKQFIKDFNCSEIDPTLAIKIYFQKICKLLDKPLVVFLDEADCLSNGTLITFLRQLRDGYINRESISFIHSLALIGLRNIRDYKSTIRDGHTTLGSASPFNIVKKSLTMSDFNFDQVKSLYNQHTSETGQLFTDEAVNIAFYYSQGQPWIVNALACEAIEEILERDHTKTIDQKIMQQAAANLMKRRDTHIDSLMDKLKEPRVRSIIEPLINGNSGFQRLSDDYEYVTSLGLIKENQGITKFANPIYSEVISRTLNYDAELDIRPEYINRWVTKEKILVNELLKEFQAYWRQNSEQMSSRIKYEEVIVQLVLLAFLQRVLNGNTSVRVEREHASGSGRVDICICYRPDKAPEGRAGELYYPIEIKVMRKDNKARVRKDGIEQINKYMDRYNAKEGWLVIFDRLDDEKTTWDNKIYWNTLGPKDMPADLCDAAKDRVVHVVGA